MAPKAISGAKSKDPWLDFYTILRKKGPEARSAVMQGIRWDFIRGKDFLAYMKENTHLLKDLPLKKTNPSVKDEELIKAVAAHMLKTGIIFRAERAQKVPKPGKKLLKFPRRLNPHPENFFVEDGFYVWQFQLPTSAWTHLGSAGLVVVTIGCCLFPLAPHWVKLGVLYLCLFLLGLIFVISIVRAAIFAVVWILFGKHLWVLPNLFSDEVGITEAFVPWYEFEEEAAARYGEEVPEPPALVSRLAAAAAAAATLYGLYTYSPETDKMAAMARKSHKSILEMLDLYEAPKQLGGGENATNATDFNLTHVMNTTNATDLGTPGEAVDPSLLDPTVVDQLVEDETVEDADETVEDADAD